MDIEQKTCFKCGIKKGVNEFYKNSTSPDGRRIRCKTCCNEIRRQQYATDEIFREHRKKESRESGHRCRDKKLKYMKDIYYKKNRKTRLAYLEKWREKNGDKVRAGLKRYRESEVGRIADAKKHARRQRALGFNMLFENILDEPIAWHHLNNNDVVAIPRDLHELFTLNNTKNHREMMMPIVEQLYPLIYEKILK